LRRKPFNVREIAAIAGSISCQQSIAGNRSMGADQEVRQQRLPAATAAAVMEKRLAGEEGAANGSFSRLKIVSSNAVSSASTAENRPDTSPYMIGSMTSRLMLPAAERCGRPTGPGILIAHDH
jgi:hypothetical protein